MRSSLEEGESGDLGQTGGEEEREEESSHGVGSSGEWQGLDCNKEQFAVPHLASGNTARTTGLQGSI